MKTLYVFCLFFMVANCQLFDYADYYNAMLDYAVYDYYDWVCVGNNCQLCDLLTGACCNPQTNRNCFLPDSCANNPCLAGGTCIPTTTVGGQADFACVCKKGLTGKYCQLIDEYDPPIVLPASVPSPLPVNPVNPLPVNPVGPVNPVNPLPVNPVGPTNNPNLPPSVPPQPISQTVGRSFQPQSMMNNQMGRMMPSTNNFGMPQMGSRMMGRRKRSLMDLLQFN